MIGIAIHGAAGRMGQRLIALGSQGEEVKLTAAIESSSHPKVGQDAGLVAVSYTHLTLPTICSV